MDGMERLLRCRQAEEELKQHRDHLEELVAERTASLQQANDRLTREVADRQGTEQALRESEEKHRLLYETSRDAIMTLAPPTWRFISGNPATVQMFGAKNEEEFTSQRPWKLSPERQPDGRASAEKAIEMIETAMREGSHFFEWTHRRLNGEMFPATVLLSRIMLAGKAFLQATVRDIRSAGKATFQEGQKRPSSWYRDGRPSRSRQQPSWAGCGPCDAREFANQVRDDKGAGMTLGLPAFPSLWSHVIRKLRMSRNGNSNALRFWY
jgi:PAS domain S-box-containing protein